ncbi:hypothetical protein IAE22_31650 [Bacillus sp. S34]|nr:hypothetical protein [Bacillus sp. S34]
MVDTDGERVVEVFRHDDEGGVLTFNSFSEVSIPFDVIVEFVNDAIRASSFLAGSCYTQLTDTMQETNGLLNADRTPKVPIEQIRRAITGR